MSRGLPILARADCRGMAMAAAVCLLSVSVWPAFGRETPLKHDFSAGATSPNDRLPLYVRDAAAQKKVRRSAAPSKRIVLAPRFVPGSVVRYQMEVRTTTEGHRTGLVEDPQAPSQLELTWVAVARMEVLSVEQDAAGHPPGRIRFRTTYEKSQATSRSDTYDPAAAGMEAQYRQLEGRTIQFTLDASGKVTDVEGLKEVAPDEKAAGAAREWLSQLAVGASLPKEGIVPGQKWTSQQPSASAPLAGIVWRTESTYLRDEKCRPTDLAGDIPVADLYAYETCAVILTRFAIAQPHAPRDPTPEEYRKNGLRTAGRWAGSGESLSYVSLRTGQLVSVTQSGAEEMDLRVSTADGNSAVRYAGRVRSQSQLTLLPDAPLTPSKK